MKKTKVLSLTTLLLALGLAGCGEKEAPKVDPCEKHSWGEYEVTKEATCKEAGSKKRVCTVCAAEEVKDIAKKTTHTYAVTSETAATCQAAGSKVEKCSVCDDVKTTTLAKLDHQYVTATDSTHTAVTATCKVEGSHWEKCSKCNEWKKVEEGFAPHAFGAATVVHDKADGTASKLSKRTCSACQKVDFVVDALSYVESGSTSSNAFANKDTSGATLKMSKNGNFVTYTITVDKAYEGMEVALYGWVDYWKDGSNNNDQKGHIVNGSPTFSVKVNDTDVAVTNDKSFEEMGMTAGEGGNGTFTLCPVGGTASLKAGVNTITYARVGSYNLNISEIHFIG
ncbi:MAG: hypothetical protein MJZ37_01630 [Bacilli bacterium]|nr:hypothetical protein [Bacilli bacterium]